MCWRRTIGVPAIHVKARRIVPLLFAELVAPASHDFH